MPRTKECSVNVSDDDDGNNDGCGDHNNGDGRGSNDDGEDGGHHSDDCDGKIATMMG